MRDFETAVEMSKVSEKDAIGFIDIKIYCVGPCRDVADNFIKKYKEETPVADRPPASVLEYYKTSFKRSRST